MLLKSFGIAFVVKTDRYLPGPIIVTSKYGLPFPLILFALYLRLTTFFTPLIAYCGRIGKRKLIFVKQNRLRVLFQEFFLTHP
jgi:alanine-alpha-ketoisovalerate/valine-pyruvate aminotransferase